MAKHMRGDNGSPSKPNRVRRQFRRLYAAHRQCEQIMSQIPGVEDYRPEDLPQPLARLLGSYGCNTMFNVLTACLMRLLTESMVPPSAADVRPSDIPGDGRTEHG